MARANLTHKPGEKAPESGVYACAICARRGVDSRRQMKAGELFVACPQCLERNVSEWDMTWQSESAERRALPWPGSLAPEG